MTEIGQSLIDAVRKAANDDPDFIYHKPRGGELCYYVYGAKPSCIVGKAAWNLGLIDASFEKTSDNTSGVSGLMERLAIDLEFDEQEWLEEAQNAQDTGASWFAAVRRADRAVALPVPA